MTRDKKAGIVLDAWKLPIFDRHLIGAGYSYEKVNGPNLGLVSLQVPYADEELPHLTKVVNSANTEACKTRMN